MGAARLTFPACAQGDCVWLRPSRDRLPLPGGERDGVRGIGPLLYGMDRSPLTRSSPSARIDLSPSGRGRTPLGPHVQRPRLVGEVTGASGPESSTARSIQQLPFAILDFHHVER